MKNSKIIFILLTSFISAALHAQTKTTDWGGLYLTAVDFQQQKLTYPIDCSNASEKIKANTFFGSSTGYVFSKGEKHSFDKKAVYGYRNCQNKIYRFYNGEAYLLIDTSGFYIYFQYMAQENVKGKALVKKDEYFFSTKPDGGLQLLTVDNLKKAFPANHDFHYKLDVNFKSDKDLIAYDNFQKSYKVKYLYNQSINK